MAGQMGLKTNLLHLQVGILCEWMSMLDIMSTTRKPHSYLIHDFGPQDIGRAKLLQV